MIILQQTLRGFIFSAKWKVYFYFMQSCWAAFPRGHTDTGVCTPVVEQEYTSHHPGTLKWCSPLTAPQGCIPEDHWADLAIVTSKFITTPEPKGISVSWPTSYHHALWWGFSLPAPPAPHTRISGKANYTGFRVNVFAFIFQVLLSHL